jgi:FixJ family two-component response regulator
MSDSPFVIVVDDDQDVRHALGGLLSSSGYEVECFASAIEFLPRSSDQVYSVIVCDYDMPGMTGIEMCSEMKARGISPPVILITAFATAAVRQKAEEVGVRRVLEKPFDPALLLAEIRSVTG